MKYRAIEDYCILSAGSQVKLSMAVRDYIEQGWQPCGSHVVVVKDQNQTRIGCSEYSQTMVKYERD